MHSSLASLFEYYLTEILPIKDLNPDHITTRRHPENILSYEYISRDPMLTRAILPAPETIWKTDQRLNHSVSPLSSIAIHSFP